MNGPKKPTVPMHILKDSARGVEILFAGRSADSPADREQAMQALAPPGYKVSWLQQIHSADVLDLSAEDPSARDALKGGCAGEGDALIFRSQPPKELAMAIVTADCVPVLFAGHGEIAAVHAGWRGLAAGILPATLQRLRTPPQEIIAWIGPSIGPCCYEVSDEVAEQVADASTPDALRPGRGERPHLDLVAAASAQLRAGNVGEIRSIGPCTRCDEHWWSYRRDGTAAGRNLSMIWFTST